MIGSGLNQEDALARTYNSPSDCTSSDSLPTGNVSELSSGSPGIPSLGRGDGKLVSCYISQQCSASTNEDQGDMSTTIQTAQILSLERTHVDTMLLKARCEVSLLEKEKELADVRLSAACAECDIPNNDPRLTVLVPVICRRSSSRSTPLSPRSLCSFMSSRSPSPPSSPSSSSTLSSSKSSFSSRSGSYRRASTSKKDCPHVSCFSPGQLQKRIRRAKSKKVPFTSRMAMAA